jgi:hypothetical protein
VYGPSRDRCPRHGALEEVAAVALADRMASREGPLAPEDALALLRAALALDPTARGELSPKRMFVRQGPDAPLALVGIAGESKPDPLDDALHDPLSRDAADVDGAQRYRFAALAFELLSGEAPFSAKTPRAVEVRKRLEPPPSLKARRADVPDAFSAALAAALARPGERAVGASAETLVDALSRALGPAPAVRQAVSAPTLIAAAAPAPPASFAPPARSSRGGLGCGALLAGLVMIAALASVFMVASKQSPQSDKQSAAAIPSPRASQANGVVPATAAPQPIPVEPMVPQSTAVPTPQIAPIAAVARPARGCVVARIAPKTARAAGHRARSAGRDGPRRRGDHGRDRGRDVDRRCGPDARALAHERRDVGRTVPRRVARARGARALSVAVRCGRGGGHGRARVGAGAARA